MTRYFLASLSIEGFRGINNDGDPLKLNFRADKVNSIHAPNAVGKSSIFEALHFAIHGTVPRLASMQDAEQGESYVVNKFHPRNTATVALTFSSDDGTPDVEIVVKRLANGGLFISSPSGYTNPKNFLAALREDFALVDYRRFAEFVDCAALERGRSFSSLVGLSRYSQLRQALEGARRTQNLNSDLRISTVEADVAAESRSLARVKEQISAAYLEIAGAELPAITDIAQHKSAVTAALASIQILSPLMLRTNVIDLDFTAAEKAIEREEGGASRRTLDSLNNAVTSLTGLAVTQAELDEIGSLIQAAQARDAAIQRIGSASIHALLKDALSVISGADWHNPNECPVCEGVFQDPLQGKLESRIALYDEAERLDAELRPKVIASACLSKLRLMEEHSGIGVEVADRISILLMRRTQPIDTADLEKGKAQLAALEGRRGAAITAASAEIAIIQESLPPSLVQITRTLGHAKNFRDAVLAYERDQPALEGKIATLAKLNRWKTFIASAAQSFAIAETNLANARIADIQATCATLFEDLVRGGPDVKPTLSRATSSEQVDLTLSDFYGLRNQSARALLSESYRNAVAAAIFLAAAVHHSGVPRFVVLDDITSSFDAGHQVKLMEIIRTRLRHGAPGGVAGGLQFIILSHDTTLEKYFDTLQGNGDWNHQKLQGMPPRGRVMVSAQEADRLKAQAQRYLSAGQLDIGEPFVRQYLEYKLGQIIARLQILVPPDYVTRGDRRTLSTYLNAITNAVSLYQQANRCVLELQQITDLQNRHAITIMANYVSHYETGTGTPFNAYAMLGVLQSIDELADCFMWTDNGQRKYYRALDRRA